MRGTVTNRLGKVRWSVLTFSLVVALGGICVLGHAQSSSQKDVPFANLDGSLPGTKLAIAASKSSEGKSAAGLSSLPADAEGPISTALGKDDSGYWVHRNAEGFHGENRRHALAVDFSRQGAEVRSHNLGWLLETRGYGYGDALYPANAVAPQAEANRVEYRRDGVTEWYQNGPLGLEQGFTLVHSPGKANGQALTLELGLRGRLIAALHSNTPETSALVDPVLEAAGRTLVLKRKDGKAALRYTGLTARDATGRELPSWMEVHGERLLLRVDDRGARYPVVVDPWIQQGELTAADGAAQDQFGNSVAISGNTVVVGSPDHTFGTTYGQGAAYVFVESGGTWSLQAELSASDGAAYDAFGWSVTISGSTVMVGAPCHTNSDGQCGQGAVYVFVGSGGTWSKKAELTATDGVAGDRLGWSVAVDGNTAVAGAYSTLVQGHSAQGAAYVFVESGGTWTQQAKLTSSDGIYTDEFGYSVALNGSTIVIGAPDRTIGTNQAQGGAYVFAGSGGTWTQQAELTASDGEAGDFFGQSVAVSGSTAVLGAPCHPRSGSPFCQGGPGAAYVFGESGGTWSQQAELNPSDGAAGDEFGVSVSVSGSTILSGASLHTVGSNQGAAYVFTGSGGTWSQEVVLAASDGLGGYFGWSVAVDGSTAAMGAPAHAVGSNQLQGAAYVFGSSGPLFKLSASPSSPSVLQGGQATSTITITPENSFNGSVSLSASGLPSGVTAVFSPNPATSTSTLTFTASTTATTGTATVIVAGTSGSLAQTTTLTLTVVEAVPTAVLSPTLLNFGNQVLNTKSRSQAVTLSNTGTGILYIYNIGISPSTNFNISNNTCGSSLNAGSSCQVSVDFKPKVLGPLSASLIFGDNAPGNPQTVTLSGTGVQVPSVTLLPASVTYAKQKVGMTSKAKTFTLANKQTGTLTGIAISTSGDFAVSATTCGASLAAKSKCTISVTFTATQTGTRTGQLSVSDSATNSPQTANLTGKGK